jgi:hypothetical protein
MSEPAIDETALRPQVLKAWRRFEALKVRLDGAFTGRPILVSDRFFVNEFFPLLRELAGEVAITSGSNEEQVRDAIDAELERVQRRRRIIRQLASRPFRRSDIAAASVCLHIDRLNAVSTRGGLVAWAVRRHAVLVLQDVHEFTSVGRGKNGRDGAYAQLDELIERVSVRVETPAGDETSVSLRALITLLPALVVERSSVVVHPFGLQAMQEAMERGMAAGGDEDRALVEPAMERLHARRQVVLERRENADLDSIIHDSAASLLRRNLELDEMLNQMGKFRRATSAEQQRIRTSFLLWSWKLSELHVQMMRLMTTDAESLRPMVADIHAMIGRGHRVAMVLGNL